MTRRRPGGRSRPPPCCSSSTALVRLAAGAPYPGATVLLLAACGLSLLALPAAGSSARRRFGSRSSRARGWRRSRSCSRPSRSWAIELTELSIRLAVLALVVLVGARTSARRIAASKARRRREGIAIAVLVGDLRARVRRPPTTSSSRSRRPARTGRTTSCTPTRSRRRATSRSTTRTGRGGPRDGALPGPRRGLRKPLILDGVSSRVARARASCRRVRADACSASTSRSAAVGGGRGSARRRRVRGRADPPRAHVLARARHDARARLRPARRPRARPPLPREPRPPRRRPARLLARSGARSHSASALVVAVVIGLVLVAEVSGRSSAARRPPPSCSRWRDGITKPRAPGGRRSRAPRRRRRRAPATACGRPRIPVSYRFFDRDWLERRHRRLLLLVAVPRARRREPRARLVEPGASGDPALAAVAALALAAVARQPGLAPRVPFEYRRVVYYAGPALVALGRARVGPPRAAGTLDRVLRRRVRRRRAGLDRAAAAGAPAARRRAASGPGRRPDGVSRGARS